MTDQNAARERARAEQFAEWEDRAERAAVAAQEAGLPAPPVPDFVFDESKVVP